MKKYIFSITLAISIITGGSIVTAAEESWQAVSSWDELRNLLSGNTLAVQIQCRTKKFNEVYVLDEYESDSESGIRDKAITIDIEHKHVTRGEWGLGAGFSYYPMIGTTGFSYIDAVDDSSIAEYFSTNQDKSIIRVKMEWGVDNGCPDYADYHRTIGKSQEAINLANSKDFEQRVTKVGPGLVQAIVSKGIQSASKALADAGSDNPSSHTYTCKFYCDGVGGSRRSEDMKVATPHTEINKATQYVEEQYKDMCASLPFYGGSGGGSAYVSHVSCERSY